MKKIVPYLLAIWVLIGLGSFFVWWKVTRGLTTENVSLKANQISSQLELPWLLRFKSIKPAYGAEFRLVISGIEAISKDGTHAISADFAELKMPWSLFFSKNPGKINITVENVKVADWKQIQHEVESFLELRKVDRVQQVSVPQHFISSSFNLRLAHIKGPLNGKELSLEKLYLSNIDPNKPTAFEVIFPWEKQIHDSVVKFETKALGEYRFAKEKIDLHFYLRNKMQVNRFGKTRSGEFSVEGKGFYHPRMGLFSTLTAKDDWISFVGDIEWKSESFKMSVPKINISHEFLFDLLPFNAVQTGGGAYQNAYSQGAFRITQSKEESNFQLDFKNKGNPKLSFESLGDLPIQFSILVKPDSISDLKLTINDQAALEFKNTKKDYEFFWDKKIFRDDPSMSWDYPSSILWSSLSKLPLSKFKLSNSDSQVSYYEKMNRSVKINNFSIDTHNTPVSLVFDLDSNEVLEWSSEFNKESLDIFFKKTGLDFSFVPGFAFSGKINADKNKNWKSKLSWSGSAIPILSKSSCKALIQEKPELGHILTENFANYFEADFESPKTIIKKWTMKSPASEIVMSGEWSNSPIVCHLKISEKKKGKKAQTHTVDLN
ncbi:MAG: hypothetical protein K2P81_15620 [Bacteriovoracaceae bacterium]|nr:hypothetical protein [Bacteriovoracaceae bacterium]